MSFFSEDETDNYWMDFRDPGVVQPGASRPWCIHAGSRERNSQKISLKTQ